ncbi:hypothetical protein AWU67_14015 [Microterricola viridarii]|uniref:Three-Cys-motif partner protein n=1 Tax=Microterricola viridarii TaxID=412690 RepID=A0A0Y0PD51_9MICO|nr:hypothetical protein AWU67_14015 [Microterricola viridarii]
MSSGSHAVWSLEPHTRAKHDLLERYLGAWYPALASHNKRILFLDGFAGPGVYASGEPGSPTIALRTLLEHSHLPQMSGTEFIFIFNEKDRTRHQKLLEVVATEQARHPAWPANVKVFVENENFTSVATEILAQLGTGRLAPTFAFLDPFGYKDVPIKLIADLMKFDRSELFIYFDHNSAVRFSTAGNVDVQFEALFGTDEFKNAPPASDPNRGTFLRDLYRDQLMKECGFKYVRHFEMVNSQGRTGNYLFFCTRHKLGLEKMKDAMWRVDPQAGNRFSDILAGQQVLFDDVVDTGPLRAELKRVFSGRTVSIEMIEDYVLVNTPFAKTHIKVKTLKPMQLAGEISSPNQRRPGTFPSETQVTFH